MASDRLYRYSILLTLLGGAFLSLIVCSTSFVRPGLPAYFLVLANAVFLLSWFLPRFSAAVFLALLPLAGNKPGTEQFYYLLFFSSVVNLGLLFAYFAQRQRGQRQCPPNALLFYGACYLFVSVLSLSSLPIEALLLQWGSRTPGLSVSAQTYNVLQFLALPETAAGYSVLSVLLTWMAVMFGLLVYLLSQGSSKALFMLAWAVFAGLLATLVFGIMDYYGFISLASIRPLDPIVNPGGWQFRMQSFFGHSGWFAEYLTLTIPFVILLLLLKCSYFLRVGLIILVLVLGEFGLLLSYQRGGWVSYPLTLLCVWAAIYLTRCIEKQRHIIEKNGKKVFDLAGALKKSFCKVAVSLPLTVLLTLGVISLLVGDNIFSAGEKTYLAQYVDRFKAIKNTSDRTQFFEAGFRLGLLHPIMGGGSESFGYLFEREFQDPEGHYYGELNLPLHGSAHNVYMQTFAGKGLVGLGALFLLFGTLVLRSLRQVLTDDDLAYERKLLLLIASCFGLAFFIYGNVQEVFYVHALQMLCFAVIGLAAVVSPNAFELSGRSRSLIPFAIVLLFFGHLVWEYGYPGDARLGMQQPSFYGCYGQESGKTGRAVRWCGVRARQPLKVLERDGRKVIPIKVQTQLLGEGKSFEFLRVEVEGRELANIRLLPFKTSSTEVLVPTALFPEIKNGTLAVKLVTGSYFIPARDLGQSSDIRVLAYQLLE